MADLNELSAQELGRRLRLARENAGIRQEAAAHVISVSRPTLVSIEQGQRRIRIQELQTLARYYQTSVNALLRREAVHTDLMPRFRKLVDTEDSHALEAVKLLNTLARADVELENVLGINRRKSYPPERGISEGDVVELGERHADELRRWLGLGLGPLADIFSVIELNLGIRLYQRRLSSGSKVAGLFMYDDAIGACILLNANHPLPRRIQSAAHELGHFVGTRRVPEILVDEEDFLSRDERFASAFGRAFVTPAESFSASFEQLKAITNKLTRRLIILLSHQYGISRQACVLRLEELRLVKKGSWEWFDANGGIKDAQAREVLGADADRPDPVQKDAVRVVSHRMSLMAHAAWKRGLMSEGQLAELLNIRRVELRSVIDQIELEEGEADDAFQLPG